MRKTPATATSAPVPDPAALTAEIARRLRQACFDAVLGLESGGDQPALTIPRAAVPLAAVKLSRSHRGSAQERRRMQAIYERCLVHYREAVRPEDAACGIDDVGAAVARFVAANFRALHGTEVDTAVLLKLERQLAGVVRATSGWAHAPARERQLYFEKMAVLAVFMHELTDQAVLQGDAAVANVRRAAHGYLRELLGVEPDALAIGPDGLALRGARDEPAAA
jgi:hypothetical protein